MNAWAIVPDHLVLALGWTLVHFLWQGALVAALLALANRVLDRDASGPRYVLASAALLAMAALPAMTLMGLSRDMAPHSATVRAEARDAAPGSEIATGAPVVAADSWALEPVTTTRIASPESASLDRKGAAGGEVDRATVSAGAGGVALDARATSTSHQGTPIAPVTSPWIAARTAARTGLQVLGAAIARGLEHAAPLWMPWLVALWGMGVSLLTLRLLGGWVIAQRIKRRVIDGPVDRLQHALERLGARMGVTRPVRLFHSGLVDVPTVIGWLRPVVLMPVGAIAGLPPAQIEALLAHELAHIRRHDYLVNLLQTVVETLLFYHPAVWWVSRRVREERENCCDDLAAAACGDRVAYARALYELEQLRLPAPAVAMAANGGSLLQRVRRLVRPAPRASLVSRCGACLVVMGSVLLVVLVLAPAAVGHRDPDGRAEAGSVATLAQFASAPEPPTAPLAPWTAVAPEAPAHPTAPPSAPDAAAAPSAPEPAAPPTPHVDAAPHAPEAPHANAPQSPVDARPAPPAPPIPLSPVPAVRPAPTPAPAVGAPQVAPRAAPVPVSVATSVTAWVAASGRQIARQAERDVRRAVRHMMRMDLSVSAPREAAAQAAAHDRAAVLRSSARNETPRMRAGAAHERSAALEALRRAGHVALDDDDLDALVLHGVEAQYVMEMSRAIGDTPSGDDLLSMHLMGVTPEYVRDMSDVLGGIDDATQLVALKVHGVTPEYASEISARVGKPVPAEELIDMRSQNVTPRQMDALSRIGVGAGGKGLVELRSHGISLGYVAQMRHFRGHDLSLDQVIALHESGIQPESVGALNVLGYRSLSVGDLVALAQHGMSVEAVAQFTSAFGRTLTVDELMALQDNGVNVVYAGNMMHLAGVTFDVEDVVTLHQHGVPSAWIAAVVEAGYPHREVPDLIALAEAGVESAYLSALMKARYGAIDPAEVVRLYEHGVGADCIQELQREGGKRLSVDEMIRRCKDGGGDCQEKR